MRGENPCVNREKQAKTGVKVPKLDKKNVICYDILRNNFNTFVTNCNYSES